MKHRVSKLAFLILCVSVILSNTTIASAATFGFEDSAYNTYADSGSMIGQSSEQVYAGTYSGKIYLNDTDNYARFAINHNAGLLKDFSGTFMAYLGAGSRNTLAPYMMLGLDANGNGTFDNYDGGDPLVIAFITGGASYTTETWIMTGLAQSDNVHVVNNRSGLDTNEYSSSAGGGLLSALALETFGGSLLWGDFPIVQVRIGAGLWPSSGTESYTAYVDDLSVPNAAVPEPGTLLLLGFGLMGLAGAAVRRKK